MPRTQGCFGIPRRLYNPTVVISPSSTAGSVLGNLTVTINADGNTYFQFGFIPDGVLSPQTASPSYIGAGTITGANGNVQVILNRGGAAIQNAIMYFSPGTNSNISVGTGGFIYLDKPPAGTWTYTVTQASSGGSSLTAQNVCLYALEFGTA